MQTTFPGFPAALDPAYASPQKSGSLRLQFLVELGKHETGLSSGTAPANTRVETASNFSRADTGRTLAPGVAPSVPAAIAQPAPASGVSDAAVKLPEASVHRRPFFGSPSHLLKPSEAIVTGAVGEGRLSHPHLAAQTSQTAPFPSMTALVQRIIPDTSPTDIDSQAATVSDRTAHHAVPAAASHPIERKPVQAVPSSPLTSGIVTASPEGIATPGPAGTDVAPNASSSVSQHTDAPASLISKTKSAIPGKPLSSPYLYQTSVSIEMVARPESISLPGNLPQAHPPSFLGGASQSPVPPTPGSKNGQHGLATHMPDADHSRTDESAPKNDGSNTSVRTQKAASSNAVAEGPELPEPVVPFVQSAVPTIRPATTGQVLKETAATDTPAIATVEATPSTSSQSIRYPSKSVHITEGLSGKLLAMQVTHGSPVSVSHLSTAVSSDHAPGHNEGPTSSSISLTDCSHAVAASTAPAPSGTTALSSRPGPLHDRAVPEISAANFHLPGVAHSLHTNDPASVNSNASVLWPSRPATEGSLLKGEETGGTHTLVGHQPEVMKSPFDRMDSLHASVPLRFSSSVRTLQAVLPQTEHDISVVSARLVDGKLSANLLVNSTSSASVLNTHLPSMQAFMADGGTSLKQISIDVGTGSHRQPSQEASSSEGSAAYGSEAAVAGLQMPAADEQDVPSGSISIRA